MRLFFTWKIVRVIRILCVLAVGVFWLTVFFACGKPPSAAPDPFQTVAEIDGAPVALSELEMFVDDVRPAVAEHFKSAYGVPAVNEENWRTQFGGEAPADYALKLALEKLTPYKVLQNWCLREGTADDISYKSFVEKWEAENEDRRKKKQAGEAVYGPETYTQRIYYDYLQDKYESDLRKAVSAAPTEEQLRKIYDENPDLFYRFGRVTMQCIVLPQDGYTRAQAAEVFAEFEKALQNGAAAEQAAEQAGVSQYFRTQVFTAEDMSTPLVQGYPEVEDAVRTLEPGKSRTIDDNGLQWLFFYCESREGNERMRVEECKAELEAMFARQDFDEKLKRAERSAQVSLYPEARELIG